MKRWSVLMTLFYLAVTAHAFDAAHYHYYRNYDAALKDAQQKDKALMVVIVSQYCPWCRKFEHATLSDVSVNDEIQKNFIPVMLIKDAAGVTVPSALKSPIVPTIYFIDPHSGDVIYNVVGFQNTKRYVEELNSARENYLLK